MKRAQHGILPSRARPLAAGLTAGFLVATMLAGCDAVEPGPVIGARPPMVSAFAMSPGAAHVDTLALADGTAQVRLDLSLRAEPGDAPIERVMYAVQWQFACGTGELDASGVLEHMGDGLFIARPEIIVNRGRRGAYRVNAWAVDAAGRLSNEVATTFALHGESLGPPVITRIQGPGTFRPPGTLRFVVHVSDPDGIDDVARAEVVTPGAGTFPLAETDNVDNRTPCDGVYSAVFGVPAGIPPGPQWFVFRAYDRDGAASAPDSFRVQITS
jgi:hypothetical protein